MLKGLSRISAGLGVAAALLAPAAAAQTLPTGFETAREVSGLTRATKVVWAPDGRRFIAEKDGLIKVAAPGSTSAQTLLDIRSDVNSFGDRGLLGLAVDSDFANHPYLYALYTYDVNKSTSSPGPDKANPTVSQLKRLTIGSNGQVVAQQVILGTYTSGPCPAAGNEVDCIPANGISHSIGTVMSTPGGSLFVGSGDGADFSVADPLSLRAYDERSLAGKIMRVDRTGRGLASHPFCPTQTDLDFVCTKLWAKGLRNPFRFTRLSNGNLFVADVGWNQYEELDLISAGGRSFGWPCYEGPIRTPTWKDRTECAAEYAKEGTANAHVGPIHSYWHNYSQHPSWAVIAGPEYTGDDYPAGFHGSVFWGDHGVGFMRRLTLTSGGQVGSMSNFIADGWHGVDLTAAPNGDIAWVDLAGWQSGQGFVDRMVYSPGNAKPTAVASASPTSGTAPLAVTFDGSGSTDPDGDALSHSWSFGDTTNGTGAKPSHTYQDAGTYTATLTVSDGRGQSDTDTVQINASNTPPVPSIDEPAAGFEYRNGVPVTVTGSATDDEQGTLPASAFEWNVRVVHHDHEHSIANPEDVKTFDFEPVRDHDSDSFYRIRLTVTDSGGAVRSAQREIHPETVPLHLRSAPAGAPLAYAGTPATAPWDTNTVIGFIGTISAPRTFTTGGAERVFLGWSSGAPRVHDFTVPDAETTLTATYNARPTVTATATPAGGDVPLAVDFEASGSDADGDALSYRWRFGDGSAPVSGATASHVYTSPGAYAASVTVADTHGTSAQETVPVSVSGEDGTPSDSAGPRLRAWRPRARPRFLAGLVRDPAGVESVRIAVAALRGNGRCRWVGGARPRLSRSRACSKKRWLGAAVTGGRWKLMLPRSLPAGRYRAWFRARDEIGNISRTTVDGAGQLRFRVAKQRQASAAGCTAPLLRAPLRCSGLG